MRHVSIPFAKHYCLYDFVMCGIYLQLRIASCQGLISITFEASRIELQWRTSIPELMSTFAAKSDKKFFNVTRNVRSPNFSRRPATIRKCRRVLRTTAGKSTQPADRPSQPPSSQPARRANQQQVKVVSLLGLRLPI